MKKELEDKLYAAYPKLFPALDRRGTTPFIQRGFEFGEGWCDIVANLAEELSKLDSTIEIFQVKEKFGILRVYTRSPSHLYDTVQSLVTKAQEQSSITCEVCSAPGKQEILRHWVRTVCSKCLEAWAKNAK